MSYQYHEWTEMIIIYAVYSVDVSDYFKEQKTNTCCVGRFIFILQSTTTPSSELQSALDFLTGSGRKNMQVSWVGSCLGPPVFL